MSQSTWQAEQAAENKPSGGADPAGHLPMYWTVLNAKTEGRA